MRPSVPAAMLLALLMRTNVYAQGVTPGAPQVPAAPAGASAPADMQAQYDRAAQQAGQGTYRLSVNANVVLTNVVARDKKTGAVIKGLKGSDFTILENGKPQRLSSFDFQNVDEAAVLAEKNTVSGKASVADLLETQHGGQRPTTSRSSPDRDVLRPELHAG